MSEIDTKATIQAIESFVREMNEYDTNYDYYEMENSEALELFHEFCQKNNVTTDVIEMYSHKYERKIEKVRTPRDKFGDAAYEVDENTDGNIDSIITVDFMRHLLKRLNKQRNVLLTE